MAIAKTKIVKRQTKSTGDIPKRLFTAKDPMQYWRTQPLRIYNFLTQNYPKFTMDIYAHWIRLSLPTPWIERRFSGQKSKQGIYLPNRSFGDHRAMMLDANLTKLSRIGVVDINGKPVTKKKKSGEEYLTGEIFKCFLKLNNKTYDAHLFMPFRQDASITLKIMRPDRRILTEIERHLWFDHLVSRVEFTYELQTEYAKWLFAVLALSSYMTWQPDTIDVQYGTTRYIGNPRARDLSEAVRYYIKGPRYNDGEDLNKKGDEGVQFEVIWGRRKFDKYNIDRASELLSLDPVDDVLRRVRHGRLDLSPLSQAIKINKRFRADKTNKSHEACSWHELSSVGKKKIITKRKSVIDFMYTHGIKFVQKAYEDVLGKQKIESIPLEGVIKDLAKKRGTFFPK